MKKSIFFILLVTFILCSCQKQTQQETDNYTLEIEKLKTTIDLMSKEINDLKLKNDVLNQELTSNKKENENNIKILKSYSLAERFITAYTKGDTKAMADCVSDNIIITDTTIGYYFEEQLIEYNIKKDKTIESRLYNVFEVDDNIINYQFIIYNEKIVDVQNTYFMTLTVKETNGIWNIEEFNFDI